MLFPRMKDFPLDLWAYGPSWANVKAAALAVGAVLLVAAAPARAEPFTIVAFGDSLSAGYDLAQEAAFPNQLQTALIEQGMNVRVINAGVSGDTTTGGLARLEWTLGDNPDLVILELGANDALRGIAPAQVEANLDAILARLRDKGVTTVLAGMLAPPNLGVDYARAFNKIYPELAERYDVPLYPFFLEGVVTRRELLREDGMHPTDEGVAEIVRRILPTVTKAIETTLASRKATGSAHQ